ncbi:MAG: glycosyltransferase [Methanofastidiosum sp.]
MDWIVLWYEVSLLLAWAVVIIFLFSGIDDLIYDIGLYCWRLYKHFKYGKMPRLTLEKLLSEPQKRIAVFVPAWNEGDVVGVMLKTLIINIKYNNYIIFVGTYPNDPKTINTVNFISQKYTQVINVINPISGPTTKGDCLNSIYNAACEYEKNNNILFDIIVMHDAEDVVHPYSFLVYNYLFPKFDAIQLPILPLPVAHRKVIHWTYADEFAEIQMKDMIVRERIRGLVPFAGVGMGFNREKFFLIKQEKKFTESALTEDYNFAKKFNDLNLKTIFVNVILADKKSSIFTPLAYNHGFISNWAYFPESFKRAVKQKTRWIFGISLQEWEFTGWKGNIFVKLSLIKDRKVFLSTIAALLAYIVLIYTIVAELGSRGIIEASLIPIIYKGTLLYNLVLIVTGMMIIRVLERFILVSRVYGVVAGFLSIPRIFVGNILNGTAAFRALYQYFSIRYHKRPVTWDKTEHKEGVGMIPSISKGDISNKVQVSQSNKSLINYAIVWNNKGFALSSQGRYPEAIEAYVKALAIDPNNAIIWNNKGLTLRKLGKYKEAIECYDKAIKLDKNFLLPRYNKGVVFTILGKISKAQKRFDRAKKLGYFG